MTTTTPPRHPRHRFQPPAKQPAPQAHQTPTTCPHHPPGMPHPHPRQPHRHHRPDRPPNQIHHPYDHYRDSRPRHWPEHLAHHWRHRCTGHLGRSTANPPPRPPYPHSLPQDLHLAHPHQCVRLLLATPARYPHPPAPLHSHHLHQSASRLPPPRRAAHPTPPRTYPGRPDTPEITEELSTILDTAQNASSLNRHAPPPSGAGVS